MEDNLTQEQVEKFRRTFQLFESDNDGMIPIDELGTLLRALGQNPNEEDLEHYKAKIDPEGNGVVDFSSFKQIMIQRFRREDKEADIIECFQAFDTAKTGVIETDEIRDYLIMHTGDEATVDAILKIADPKETNAIAYVEIIKKVMAFRKKGK
jgi:Ca2+-binding EF-hand superfamily protein